jgi:ATP-dependent protease ClpP protease subunit
MSAWRPVGIVFSAFWFIGLTTGTGLGETASAGASGGVECHPVLEVNPSGWHEEQRCFFSMNLRGEIGQETAVRLEELFDARRRWIGERPPPTAGNLTVDSPGGSVAAAMAIGRMLREARTPISVPRGHYCVSACVLVLAGAVERMYGGRVGIHRPYLSLPTEAQRLNATDVRLGYAELLKQIRAYLREMNVTEQLADDMLAIDPSDVRYLLYPDLKKYGLVTYDPIEQETRDLMEAQRMGLDRADYIRRQALAKRKCRYPALDKALGHAASLPEFEACWQRIMKSGE